MVSQVGDRVRAGPPTATPLTVARPRLSPGTLAWAAAPAAVALGGAFVALTLWMALMRHATFNTGRFDLEIYTQVVWNTAHGRPFETTLLKTNLNHLAEHVALVLVPISWLYAAAPDPRVLITIQQVALGLLGWPVYQWASRALGSPWQALVALACFYAGPALAGIALDDFHAVTPAALPLAVGFWLVLAGRPRLGAAIALLALPMEEESGLILLGLGAFLFWRRQRTLGLVVGAVAALWLALAVFVVMPRFHHPATMEAAGGNRTVGHFADLAESPGAVAGRLVGQRGLEAAVWLVLPTAGLAVLAPWTLVVAAPAFLALLLQDRDDTFGRHWAAPLLAVLWLGTVAGLARLPERRARWVGLGALVLGTAAAFRLVSPLPGGGRYDAAALRFDERTSLLERAIERIPPASTVVASSSVVAHLANRPEAYVFPIDSHYAESLGWRRKRPDFYVLDLYDDLTNRATISNRLNPLNADRPYHVWSAGRKILVLADRVPEPTALLDVGWAGRLRLKGYDLETSVDGARLVLHWERYGQIRGRYDRDLTVLDGRGNSVLHEEDMALSATYGSNKWRPGQTILDEILLPPAAGPLRVRVAWVAQEKRKPIVLDDGREAFELVLEPNR